MVTVAIREMALVDAVVVVAKDLGAEKQQLLRGASRRYL
jgi:hypothetical protein